MRQPRRFQVSLRTRFTTVVLLAAIPGFVVAYLAVRSERTDDREQAETESELILASGSARYVSALEQTQVVLDTLSAVPPTFPESPTCGPLFQTIVERSHAHEALLVARPDGSVSCGSQEAPPASVAESPWFGAALESDEAVVTVDGSLVGALAVRGSDNEPLMVIAAEASLSVLDAALLPETTDEGATLVLLGPDDTVLYGTGSDGGVGERAGSAEIVRQLRARGGRGTVVARGIDGVERIYAYLPVAQPDGAVLYAGIPTDVAYAGASERFRDRVVWLAVATIVALALGFAVAYVAIARRIRRLSQVTRRLGRGDMTARSSMRAGDEIGALGQAIDAMAGDLEAREEERAQLLAAVVAAAENERRRIASDVHDDSIQVMSAHVIGLQLLRRRIDDPELQARIAELEESGRAATGRLRELVFELHSPILEERGLGAALDVLLERTFEGSETRYTLASSLASEPPTAIRDTAYRVAQEALTNARVHADARMVHVAVRHDGDDLVVRIADDGKGFVRSAVEARPGHLGLTAAMERAAAVGGALVVDSRPGGGTTVVCRLPWSLHGAAETDDRAMRSDREAPEPRREGHPSPSR